MNKITIHYARKKEINVARELKESDHGSREYPIPPSSIMNIEEL